MTLDIIDMLLNSNIPYQSKLRCIYELCNKQYKEYIRFGELPADGCSKKGNGIIGDGYECVGKEKGVSVWDCVYNFDTDLYQLIAPHPTKTTYGDFSTMAFPDHCLGCDPNEKIYVVTGIEVGYGADNEPLLKDVKIVKELPFDYFRQKVISDKKLSVKE